MCRIMLNIYDHDIPDILIYIYILDGIKQLSLYIYIYQTLSTYKYMHRLLYYIRRICEPYVYIYKHLLSSLLPDKHQCTCLAGCRLPLPQLIGIWPIDAMIGQMTR
jgi:hypothetical protein